MVRWCLTGIVVTKSFTGSVMSSPLQQLGAGGFLPLQHLGGGANMMPAIEALIELPEMLDSGTAVSSRGRINRAHTKAVRQALFNAMAKHHRVRIPQHFNKYKQVKYQYKKRNPITLQKKVRRDPADLVKSKRTKQSMTRKMTIRMSGTAGSGKVTATGVMTWPPGFYNPDKGPINRAVMNDEIASFTFQETMDVGDDFIKEYIRLIAEDLRSRRVSRRIKARVLSQLGVIL